MHQKDTNLHDGANGVTECPIPPNGGTRVYRFRAQQYGSSWYRMFNPNLCPGCLKTQVAPETASLIPSCSRTRERM